ncbi:MAG: hypothetical protein MJB14_10605 [Spirochaetes bacterium]|nr:hypothetical protein [Spirochaetota bacterium]
MKLIYKIVVYTFLILLPFSLMSEDIFLIPGSNIYNRIFLFFFPLTKEFDSYFFINGKKLTIDLKMDHEKIHSEPMNVETEGNQIFLTDLVFRISDIPIHKTGKFLLPLTVITNFQILKFQIEFTIVSISNVMVMKGAFSDLSFAQLLKTKDNRSQSNWNYPIYFDLRIQFSDELLEHILKEN